MGIPWAWHGHSMGIAGTWIYNPKAKRDTVPGIQKPGVQRGVANTPLAKSANALWDISLYFATSQPERLLTGERNKPCGEGEPAGGNKPYGER